MDYKILGKDLKVSAVGLGCMGMSHAYGSPADKNEMCELIAKAVDLGYNFFDTAEIYGSANNPHDNEELNIGFVAFSPLANGFLSGKYNENSKFEKGTDYRTVMPQFTADGVRQNKELIELLNTLAKEKNATPAQISLAWMMCKKPYIVPIPGTRKLDRLIENAGSADIILTSDEVSAIDNKLDNINMSAVFGGSKVIKKRK